MCHGTTTTWVPEALATFRIKSGWQKMTRGVIGPIQIMYPLG